MSFGSVSDCSGESEFELILRCNFLFWREGFTTETELRFEFHLL